MSELKKGTAFLITGWIIQLIAGYVINFYLARSLGREAFGIYGVVMSILIWIEIGAINSFPLAIQKFVSADVSNAGAIVRSASRLQFFFIMVLFLIGFGAAPYIADTLKDGSITFFIRIAVVDIWLYGFFFVFQSLQNGLKNFGRQSIIMVIYSIAKLCFVLLFVSMSRSITSALLANVAGSGAGLTAGIIFFRKVEHGENDHSSYIKPLIRFVVPIAIYSIMINLLLNVDLWIVKYFLGSGCSADYYSAGIIAKVPYYLFFSISAVALPAISNALADKRTDRVGKTIQNSLRYLIILSVIISVLATVYGREIINLFFGPQYLSAGDILKVLIWGMSSLACFFLLTTIINADNRPVKSFMITGVVLIIDLILNLILVQRMGVMGAALSTTVSVTTGCIIAGCVVIRRFNAFIKMITVIRVASAAVIIYFISNVFTVRGAMIIISGAALAILYGLILILMRELSWRELLHF